MRKRGVRGEGIFEGIFEGKGKGKYNFLKIAQNIGEYRTNQRKIQCSALPAIEKLKKQSKKII